MTSHIKSIDFKKGLPHELEIIPIADTILKHRDNIALPHRDTFYNVFWYKKGSANHLVDFKPIKVKANSILFVNKHRVQMLDQKGGYDGKFLLFTDKFFGRYPDDIKYLNNNILFNDLLEEPILNLKSNSLVISAFNAIESELSQPNDPLQYQLLHNLLYNFLMLAEREKRTSGFNEIRKGEDFDRTVLFKNLLEDNFKSVKTVSGYAKLMHISTRQLSKATTTTLGKNPKELIDERIILEAKRILVFTNSSIKEIGFDLGFHESTNFVKYFRKHEGKTPVDFKSLFC